MCRRRRQLRRDDQLNERQQEQAEIRRDLRAITRLRNEPVRREVSEEQRALKEDEARGPHRGRAAEKRKDPLAGNRLDEEEKGAAEKDCNRVTRERPRLFDGGDCHGCGV